MFQVTEAFQPRQTEFLGIFQERAWSLKLYSIIHQEETFERASFDIGWALAQTELPEPAETKDRPGVGFVIFHQGKGVSYLVLCWWDRENELPIKIFVREHTEGAEWRPAEGAESVCVWDLEVIHFEKQTFVETVLNNPDRSSIGNYLDFTLG